MNGIQIKERIDRNNKIIMQLISPNSFILNNTISELLEENKKLQSECEHQYEDNYCIFCYKEKQ